MQFCEYPATVSTSASNQKLEKTDHIPSETTPLDPCQLSKQIIFSYIGMNQRKELYWVNMWISLLLN